MYNREIFGFKDISYRDIACHLCLKTIPKNTQYMRVPRAGRQASRGVHIICLLIEMKHSLHELEMKGLRTGVLGIL